MTKTEDLLLYGLKRHAEISVRLDTIPAHNLRDIPETLVRCANTLVSVCKQISRSTVPESNLRKMLAECIELLTFVDVRLDRLEAGEVGDKLFDDLSL